MKEIKLLVQTRYKGLPVRPTDPNFTVDNATAERWEKMKICKIVGEAESEIKPIDLTSKKNDEIEKIKNLEASKIGQQKHAAPSLKKVETPEIEALKAEADELDVPYAINISAPKLKEKISEKKAEIEASIKAITGETSQNKDAKVD